MGHIVKLLNTKDKEKILEPAQERHMKPSPLVGNDTNESWQILSNIFFFF